MKKVLWLLLLLVLNYPSFSIEKSLELRTTGYLADLSFPAFDVDISYSLYKKDIHHLMLTTALFTMVNGNSVYTPTFVTFGPLIGIDYRIITKNGFLFTLEMGMGAVGEFFIQDVYSEDKGFYRDLGTWYGIFSVGSRMGYDFTTKYKVPMQLSFVFSYRMQFPFNLNFNPIILMGVSLSYAFDLKK